MREIVISPDQRRMMVERGAPLGCPHIAAILKSETPFVWLAREKCVVTTPDWKDGRHVLCIADDDRTPTGPMGFGTVSKALRESHYVIIHATGAEAWHGAMAVFAADLFGSCTIIETQPGFIGAWKKAVEDVGRHVDVLFTPLPRAGKAC
ncbi:hypothetical protein [Roseomonas xinghualingensis]|uniref:hypothetical protein n=1 Tax=Roseomonas xinghualingensis TaxID=2986475 RepID=UPI0021F23A26|nr:hypothetical protein [Roseomonas sp. SXEYE001]MCV4209447.1 hypothetical protein [Roseomonas sp. SXEYE001]